MNLVAHQLLSYNIPEIQIGNLLGEVVRGKNYRSYPLPEAVGVLLHRRLDTFTDVHPIVKETTAMFHERYGKYAPIITDVVYDYYLIKNWHLFNCDSFEFFKNSCYKLFTDRSFIYPEKLKEYVGVMLEDDWFNRYSTYEGVELTLSRISNRTKFSTDMANSVKEIYLNEKVIEKQFLEFFPEIQRFCKDFIIRALPQYEEQVNACFKY